MLYEIYDLKKEHAINNDQALYLIAKHFGVTWEEVDAEDLLMLYQKSLIKNGKVNTKVVFRAREAEQGILDLNPASKPIGTDEELNHAHKLEEKLVIKERLTPEFRKKVADEFFHGDLTVARYFIIFRAMFPVKDKNDNKLWNKHFGITFDDASRWDSSIKVAKHFHKNVYIKLNMGAFLAGTYYWVRDSINEDGSCFVTKPHKYLLEQAKEAYDRALDRMNKVTVQREETVKLNTDGEINKLGGL